MSDKADLRTELLIFGFVNRLKKQYAKDVVSICISFYFENSFFKIQDPQWYRLENHDKTAISLSIPKNEYAYTYCNNFVHQLNQPKTHRWRFKIDATHSNKTISFGILIKHRSTGHIARWIELQEVQEITFKKNDYIDIYLSFFEIEQCKIFVHVNNEDYDDLIYRIDPFWVNCCSFTAGWEAVCPGIKITLVNYKSMHLQNFD